MVTFSSAMNVEDSTSVRDKIRSLWPPEHPAGALSTDTASRSVGLGKAGQRNFSSTGGRAPGAFFYQTMKFYTRVPKEVAVGLRVRLFIVVVCPIRGQQTSASGRSTYLPGQGDKRITRDWQRFTHNKWCKTSIFFANFSNVLLWYLRMVLRITGEILVDILNNLRWIFCRDWNFLPQVKPLLTA